MPISFTVASTAPAKARVDILAVPVTAGPTLGHGADAVEAGFPGSLSTFMERAGFEGKAGQSLFVPLEGPTASALLVGVGPPRRSSPSGRRARPASPRPSPTPRRMRSTRRRSVR